MFHPSNRDLKREVKPYLGKNSNKYRYINPSEVSLIDILGVVHLYIKECMKILIDIHLYINESTLNTH